MQRRRVLLLTTASILGGSTLSGCQALQGDEADVDAGATETPTATATTDGPASVPAAESQARALFRDLTAGDFEAAHVRFAESARSRMAPADLSQLWAQLEGSRGAYRGIGAIEHTTDDGSAALLVTLAFERGQRQVRLPVEEGELTGLSLPDPAFPDWAPPDYVQRSAFSETERNIEATADCTLGATLSLPAGDAPVPGVVLVHGTGAHDRDVTVGANKPFRELAWGLASRGIAVLRYDKRTVACDVDRATVTVDDVITDDAVAALELLRRAERVRDDARIVVGHSTGGTFAPRIAARDGTLAGVGMLAPLGRSVPDAIVAQNEHLLSLDGTISEREERQLARVRQMADRIRTLDIEDGEVVHVGGRPFWRSRREYDHFAAARALDVPRLLTFGGQDWQVTLEEDRDLWREALRGEERVTMRTFHDLNHFLMPSQGAATRLEYRIPNHVAESLVTALAAWIGDVTGEPGE